MLSTNIPIKYIDKLQRANADDLAFYPISALQKALDSKHIIAVEENGDPAGYLWYGAIREGKDVSIFQACVDYDLRRQHLGFEMLKELVSIARAGKCTGIKLTCASSAQSNMFWQTAGFYCYQVKPGGIKRGRDLNYYRTDLIENLYKPEIVIPSEKPINESAYHKQRRERLKLKKENDMPSRFSRTHY
jgi:ribosomal protein S18 acetylase RimI-like enzyme